MIIFIIFGICSCSILLDVDTFTNITDQFFNCKLNSENQKYLLFQCEVMNVLIPKLELHNEEIQSYRFNHTEQAILSNELLAELLADSETLAYSIRLSHLLFSGYGNMFLQFNSSKINSYDFYQFQNTEIDGILNIIGLLISHKNSAMTTFYFIPVYVGKMNSYPPTYHNFSCGNETCQIVSFKQYYNKIRHTLVIFILEQNLLNIFEYSFIEFSFREVAKYSLNELSQLTEIPQSMQLFNNYLVIEFQTKQVLFSLSIILYQLKFISYFQLSKLTVDTIHNQILEENEGFTNLYQIIQSQDWKTNPKIKLLKRIELPYSQAIYRVNKESLIFFYDNYQVVQYNLEIIEDDFTTIEECQIDNNSTIFDIKMLNLLNNTNQQLMKYQSNLLKQNISYQETSNIQQQLIEYQGCNIPCDILYQDYNVSVTLYEQECILNELQSQLTNNCNYYSDCTSCMIQIGCIWSEMKCQLEQQLYQINLTSHEKSSQWFFGKVMKCEEAQQQEQQQLNAFCNYDQHIFEVFKSITYVGQIRKGQICSWFFDAGEIQAFQLLVKGEFLKTQIIALPSICLGNNRNNLCEQIKIENWEQNEITGYTFRAQYFRYSILFFEDTLANNLTISFIHGAPTTISERLRQSLIQMLAWLFCGILLFSIMGYIAKRRLQYIVAHTLEVELHYMPPQQQQMLLPLSTENLNTILEHLLEQEVFAKYPSDPSLMIYGEESCSFCFEKFDSSEIVAQMFCGHVYHYQCFEDWIRVRGNLEKCPTCNQKVEHFLANKEQFAMLKSQILENINEQERSTTNLIE